MTHSINLCSWNSPAPSAGNTAGYLSRSVFPPTSPNQKRLTTEFVDLHRNVFIVQDYSDVKFHDFFALKYFMKYFRNIKKISRCFFRLYV